MKNTKIRKIVMTAMLSAIAAVLMFFEFSVPFMPVFIKFDISELPALIASFSMGPFWGAAVCLVKNIIKAVIGSNSGGVGELANFLLGAAFVLPAGFIYKSQKSRRTALIGSLVGSLLMAAISVPLNYFVTYPIYQSFMPLAEIIEVYKRIFGGVNSLLECLLIFNMPFTFVKGLIVSVITFIIYKRISPVIKGRT